MKNKAKEKREAWKNFKRTGSENDRHIYIEKRNKTKDAVERAKRDS